MAKADRKPRKAHQDRRVPAKKPPPDSVVIYGLHAVQAALHNPRRKCLHLTMSANAADRLKDLPDGLQTEVADSRALDRLTGPDAVHQGVVLTARPLPEPVFDPAAHRLWLILDQVTDPHNVGAILRSAVAIGADAVLTTRRNAPSESGVLLKSASGAFEHIDYVRVGNLADGLRELGKAGVFRIGLDSDESIPMEQALQSAYPNAPIALVLGAEGKGMRALTRSHCDQLARLDLNGPIRSLNVSNAAALALYLTHQALIATS